jgi:hypothetical protein
MAKEPTFACKGCLHGRHRRDYYLCRRCWFALPKRARDALWLCDQLACKRRTKLYGLLGAGVPPGAITPEMLA